MFPRTSTPPLARRLLSALRLLRSFLLLEDDYDVDWEVDRDEPYSHQPSPHKTAREELSDDHPHRAALRSRLGSRRPGAPAPREQVCLCPLPPLPAHGPERDAQRGSRITTGIDRVAIDR
jgi:hypothetical protein